MILNGLGFVSARLYLFEKFFIGKATEHLLGEGIHPEHLNDDRLGRVLDKLYSKGLTEVFVTVAVCNMLVVSKNSSDCTVGIVPFGLVYMVIYR